MDGSKSEISPDSKFTFLSFYLSFLSESVLKYLTNRFINDGLG